MSSQYQTYLEAGERAGAALALTVPRSSLRGLAGSRVGSTPGSSLEFRDFRDYQPGDDLRRIDWGAYARSDRLTVRIFHDEVAPHLDIVLDGSRSMALEDTAKTEAALGVAAALAVAAANAGCTHRCWLAANGFTQVINGHDAPHTWDGLTFNSADTVAQAFAGMPPAWRPRGIRVLISDLLWIEEPARCLRLLVDGAADLAVVQVLARVDIEPASRGNATLVDSETGEQLRVFIDAVTERRYRENLDRHRNNWHRACRQHGARLVTLTAEDVVADWRLQPLLAAGVVGGA